MPKAPVAEEGWAVMPKVRVRGDEVVAQVRRAGHGVEVSVREAAFAAAATSSAAARVDGRALPGRRSVAVRLDGEPVDMVAERLLAALAGAPPAWMRDVEAVQAALDAEPDVDAALVLDVVLTGAGKRVERAGDDPDARRVLMAAYPEQVWDNPTYEMPFAALVGLIAAGNEDVATGWMRRGRDVPVEVAMAMSAALPDVWDWFVASATHDLFDEPVEAETLADDERQAVREYVLGVPAAGASVKPVRVPVWMVAPQGPPVAPAPGERSPGPVPRQAHDRAHDRTPDRAQAHGSKGTARTTDRPPQTVQRGGHLTGDGAAAPSATPVTDDDPYDYSPEQRAWLTSRADSDDVRGRCAAALVGGADETAALALALDPDDRVAACLTRAAYLPPPAVAVLLRHRSHSVRLAAARNGHGSEEQVQALVEQMRQEPDLGRQWRYARRWPLAVGQPDRRGVQRRPGGWPGWVPPGRPVRLRKVAPVRPGTTGPVGGRMSTAPDGCPVARVPHYSRGDWLVTVRAGDVVVTVDAETDTQMTFSLSDRAGLDSLSAVAHLEWLPMAQGILRALRALPEVPVPLVLHVATMTEFERGQIAEREAHMSHRAQVVRVVAADWWTPPS